MKHLILISCNKDKRDLQGTWLEHAQLICPNSTAPTSCTYTSYTELVTTITFEDNTIYYSNGVEGNCEYNEGYLYISYNNTDNVDTLLYDMDSGNTLEISELHDNGNIYITYYYQRN